MTNVTPTNRPVRTVRPRKTAVAAVVREANTDVTFSFEGHDYTVDIDGVRDVEFLEAFEDGKMITAIRTLMGPKQWAEFKTSKPRITDEDLIDMANTMFEAVGVDEEK